VHYTQNVTLRIPSEAAECSGGSLKAYTDPPVRDELARVKLDMTVCTVGHS